METHNFSVDRNSIAQQRQQTTRLPLEDMGNVLLDAMQGTLVCLDNQHTIVDVSKAMKQYFGFEQVDLIGLSILLLIEDSERDAFARFLNNSSQSNDICCVRMMTNNPNEYRQVQVHRKKKLNQDTIDVHSTTPRHSYSISTILLITLDDSCYIDITLHDIAKQEFYTKMNLIGEIQFGDHRGTLITGYLPHEIVSQSIFNFVYHEDRLVKLHALWKCVTTGSSKLQWRFLSRNETIVFLQTEYKLVTNHCDQDIIVARNEVLSPIQKSQFDELQTAWKHQCTADIKGNSSSFKKLSSLDNNALSISDDECRISVPSLNMCFMTKKLHPLTIQGNIFDLSKSRRPLTIQDYLQILIEHDQYIDSELTQMIANIQTITARFRRSNDDDSSNFLSEQSLLLNDGSSSSSRKQDSDSIVRGILSNSMKYNHEKSTSDANLTLERILNGSNSARSPSATQNQTNSEVFHQQHIDFLKKYKAAKTKLESQLELVRNQETLNGNPTNDSSKRNSIINKLNQLENIKNKHLARRHDYKRQTSVNTNSPSLVSTNSNEQKDFLNSLFSSPPTNTMDFLSNEQSNKSNVFSSPNNPTFYSQQTNSTSSIFDDLLPPTSIQTPTNSFMNLSYQNSTNDSTTFLNQQHNTTYPY